MQQVTIYAAKTHLSRLIRSVEGGDEIIIARARRPVAKLVPIKTQGEPRQPGIWEGKVWVAPDFNKEDKGVNSLFYGEE